jgi:hypothetical protein
MLTYNALINYYLSHPPFAITNQELYLDLVQNQVEVTLLEISENEPIIEEKTIFLPVPLTGSVPDGQYTTGTVTDATGVYVWLDLYSDIDPAYMSFILFAEKNPIPSLINMYISHEIVQTAMGSGSLYEIMALKDGVHVWLEWLNDPVSKIIYKDRKIKVKPGVEYYVIYRRYRQVSELRVNLFRIFRDLLGCNIILGSYESSTFMDEDGVSSFSMSGLSISFNTPRVEERIKTARDLKDKIMATLALDGSEIGTF